MRAIALCVFSLFTLAVPGFGQSDTIVTKITSPVQLLPAAVFGGTKSDPANPQVDPAAEPYASGKLTKAKALDALHNIGCVDDPKVTGAPCYTNVTTIIHVLRWQDAPHTKVKFDRWYVFDPRSSRTSFYVPPSAEFTGTSIPGRTSFQLVFFHLDADLTKGTSEWAQQNGDQTVTLQHPVSYSVSVAKAQTQFLQDLKSVLQITGVMGAAGNEAPPPGYFSVGTFKSQWTTSTITVTASLDAGDKNQPSTTSDKSSQLASKAFANERPTWIGLSGGVQITSYKDVTYQSSSGTLNPSSVTSKNVYLFFDAYAPPVIAGLRSFRYLPHPTVGLPVKGKVLRHIMLGGAIGLKWCEPYGGIVFDTENNQVKTTGSSTATSGSGLTIQPVLGLKISISAVAKSLKSK